MTLPAFAVVPAMSVGMVLTQQPGGDGGDSGGQGADFGKSSPVGLLLLLVFFVAVAFLVRSMTKHLKRVPASFDPTEVDSGTTSDDPPGAAESAETDLPEDSAQRRGSKRNDQHGVASAPE